MHCGIEKKGKLMHCGYICAVECQIVNCGRKLLFPAVPENYLLLVSVYEVGLVAKLYSVFSRSVLQVQVVNLQANREDVDLFLKL